MQNIEETTINYSVVNKKFNGSFETLIMTYVLKNLNKDKLSFKNFINDIEGRVIQTALKLTGGNQRKAASILGLKATTFNEKFKKHNIDKKLLKIDPSVILDKNNINLLN